MEGVGYGASGPAYPADSVGFKNEKIGGENTIDTIEGYSLNGIPTLLAGDFDSPNDPQLNAMGDAKPLPLKYSPCGGNSGSGLFHKRAVKWELVGICSGATFEVGSISKFEYCGEIMHWTRVSAFIEWIQKVMRKS